MTPDILNQAYISLKHRENCKHIKNWKRQEIENGLHRARLIPWLILTIIIFILAILLFSCDKDPVWAMEIPSNFWQGLIAEDVSGGYQGMYAVACCVRNRLNIGMTMGLVGLKRKDLDAFVKRQGVKYELMAKDIVRKVFYENAPDITKGATHYENIERFGIPYWAKDMVRIVKVKSHTFYKSN